MTQPGLQEQGIVRDLKSEDSQVYQLAINRGFRTNWNAMEDKTLKVYHLFRREIDVIKGTIHAIPMSRAIVGDYNNEFYEIYTVHPKKDAETLKKSILEAKISKEVFIDELFSPPKTLH